MSRKSKTRNRPARGPRRRSGVSAGAWIALGAVLLVAAVYLGQRALQGPGAGSWEIPRADVSALSDPVQAQVTAAVADVEARPGSAAAWGHLGSLYDLYELNEAALECYGRARQLAPEDFRWPYFTAIVLDRQGAEAQRIDAAFEAAIEVDLASVAARYRYGDSLLQRGEARRAAMLFEQAARRQPGLAVAHRGLGRAMLALDRPRDAIEHLERAAELHPGDGAIWSALANAYRQTGQPQRAAEAAARIEGADSPPDLPDPVRGRMVQLAVDPDSSIQRAQQAMARGDYARAIPDLERFLEALPDHAIGRYFLGKSYLSTGRPDEAMQQFRLALATDDTIPEAHHLLGTLLAERGRLDDAVPHMRRALELRPDDARVQAQVGLSLGMAGDLEGAIQGLRRAAELRPDDVEVLHNLGTALMRHGEWREAAERFRHALEIQPDSANTLYNLGTALEELGRTGEAIDAYRRAAALDPGHLAAGRLAELNAQ